ncbi:MAG: phosphohistidine phosphatase SixA [Spirochaetota bacterium]|nr:phosphohistidine phosphatase SixA [Spirochaetota bacterium]
MNLYLVRHADASDAIIDSLRSLSKQGETDIKKVSNYIKNLNINVKTIYHSGKLRAEQTAIELSKNIISETGIEARNDLNPMDNVESIIEFISNETDDIMLVGHLPFMNILAASLTGKSEHDDNIQFPTACLIHLQRLGSGWQLKLRISPNIIHE